MGLSKNSDFIKIKIKMPNPSQEPPASSKAQNQYFFCMSFSLLVGLLTFESCPDHFWPHWDHVCPNFISRPHADLKFWRLSHYDQGLMSMEWLLWDHVNAIFGPCYDHAYPSFTFRPAKALKFSRLSQHSLRHTFMMCPLLGPCQGHVFTMLKPHLA